jgi:hypothetical protein
VSQMYERRVRLAVDTLALRKQHNKFTEPDQPDITVLLDDGLGGRRVALRKQQAAAPRLRASNHQQQEHDEH